jgi:hypothetical protein
MRNPCAGTVDETLPESVHDYEDVLLEKEAGVLAQNTAHDRGLVSSR